MECKNCSTEIVEDPDYKREYSYGYRHSDGPVFCASSQKIAKPEGK